MISPSTGAPFPVERRLLIRHLSIEILKKKITLPNNTFQNQLMLNAIQLWVQVELLSCSLNIWKIEKMQKLKQVWHPILKCFDHPINIFAKEVIKK